MKKSIHSGFCRSTCTVMANSLETVTAEQVAEAARRVTLDTVYFIEGVAK